jgi:hypothetical protein
VHVSQLWRYPVKSMLGDTVTTVDLAAAGIVGDRPWAVLDARTGAIRGGKQIPSLMQARATFRSGDVAVADIELPDGSHTATDDPAVHRRLSEAFAADLRLEALHPPADLDFYRRRPPTGDPLAEARAALGRTEDEPLPDMSWMPATVFEFQAPPGSFVDAFPLLILSTSALRTLTDALPGSNPEVRRFRPSIVVDTGTAPGHPELGWPSRSRWRVGTAEIEIVGPCPRCVMPTRALDHDVPEDRPILRHIVRELDGNVGVYAEVVVPGRCAVGDPFAPA